jgi:tetratricopeptide (TPR) repeat protein
MSSRKDRKSRKNQKSIKEKTTSEKIAPSTAQNGEVSQEVASQAHQAPQQKTSWAELKSYAPFLLGVGIAVGGWLDLYINAISTPLWLTIAITFATVAICVWLYSKLRFDKKNAYVAGMILLSLWAPKILDALSLSSAFDRLEVHPYLKLSTQLISIALIPITLWLLCFYVRRVMRTRESSLNLEQVIAKTQYHKRLRLLVTLLAVISTVGGSVWSYQIIKRFRNEERKIIVLIARFDGKKEDEQRVMTHIFEEVNSATKDIPGVEVRSLDEIITAEQGSKKARDIGRARNAKLVLWGWYDSDIVGRVHLEPFLSPPIDDYLIGDQRKFSAATEGGSISIKQRLSGEFSYITLLIIGLLRIEARAYDEAINIFNRALAYPTTKDMVDPSTIYGHRGIAYCWKKKLDEAIADFNQAIRLKPDYAEAYLNRGSTYGEKGRFDEAMADLTQAIRLKPDNGIAYYNRGVVYTAKGKLDEAIAEYNQAIRFKPDYDSAYYNRGFNYGITGRFDEAIADFNQAIKLKPNYVTAYNNRGLSYRGQGKLDEAIANYDQAISIKPDFAEPYNNRGAVYLMKGQLDKAISDFSQVIRLKPDSASAYKNRGFAYKLKNDKQNAIADIRKCLELSTEPSSRLDALDKLRSLGVKVE